MKRKRNAIKTVGPTTDDSFCSWMSSMEELCQVSKYAVSIYQPTFIIVWDNVAFHLSHAVTEWFAGPSQDDVTFPSHITRHSSSPKRSSVPYGSERFMTTNLMITCYSRTQWMQYAWTYQQKIARDGSGMKNNSFLGVFPYMTYDMMLMKICDQMH